jgi:hypothetical protein
VNPVRTPSATRNGVGAYGRARNSRERKARHSTPGMVTDGWRQSIPIFPEAGPLRAPFGSRIEIEPNAMGSGLVLATSSQNAIFPPINHCGRHPLASGCSPHTWRSGSTVCCDTNRRISSRDKSVIQDSSLLSAAAFMPFIDRTAVPLVKLAPPLSPRQRAAGPLGVRFV